MRPSRRPSDWSLTTPGAHFCLGLSYLIVGDRGAALEEYRILKDLDANLGAKLFALIYP